MEQPYPLGSINAVPEDGYDPGRMRNYAFFKEVYGGTESAVRGKLKSVALGSGRFFFNGENGAAAALQAAFSEVSKLVERDPGVYGFVYPVGGTFNYRVIAGTNQLSAHAFAIAIDLRSDPGDYWRWATREQGQRRLDAYPQALVRVFEDNGFIWGGKWSHFDFLHYEYRLRAAIKGQMCRTGRGRYLVFRLPRHRGGHGLRPPYRPRSGLKYKPRDASSRGCFMHWFLRNKL